MQGITPTTEGVPTTTESLPISTTSIEPSTPPTDGCSQNFNDLWGTFTSPLFPHDYPFGVDCEWRFFAPQGSQVRLK